MTDEEFLQIASKAGFSLHEDHYAIRTMLAIFGAYVAEAEREACESAVLSLVHGNVTTCAAAILARRNT